MKKLAIVLSALQFMFSCVGPDKDPIVKSLKQGIVRVEIEHGDFSDKLQQTSAMIMLQSMGKSLKDLKIKGTDQSFEFKKEEKHYINNIYFYTASFEATAKDLGKKLVYETSEKVSIISLDYDIKYKEVYSKPGQDIPIKVKIYVDGKLKQEKELVYKLRLNDESSFHMIYNILLQQLVI